MINQKLLEQAYRKVYSYSEDTNIEIPAGLIKLIEEYEMLFAIDQFQQTPMQLMPYEKPVRKAKEIALEAAIKITPPYFSGTGNNDHDEKMFIDRCETIYQWLIKKDSE